MIIIDLMSKANPEKFVIENIDVWHHEKCLSAQDVLIENGTVKEISSHLRASPKEGLKVIAGKGKILIPSGVDPQVHLRVPGQPVKETPETVLRAACLSGFGALLTMPNTNPVIDNPDVLDLGRNAIAEAIKQYPVKVLWSSAITKGQKGQQSVDFLQMIKAGVVAFTDDGLGVKSNECMKDAFRASAETGIPILQHAETPGHGCVLAEGPTQNSLKLSPYLDDYEVDMVERDIKLLADYKEARYHVLHISSRRTLDLVKKAKDKGLKVTCEVSPHHLWFTSDQIDLHNSSFKMNPPLRSKLDMQELRKGLRTGDVDFVATDHAPHEPTAKTENFKTAAFGTIGLETSLKVLLNLVHSQELSAERLVQVFSLKPAEFLAIQNEFGTIKVGRPFHGIIVDPKQENIFGASDILGQAKNSCFLGVKFYGELIQTFLHGIPYL